MTISVTTITGFRAFRPWFKQRSVIRHSTACDRGKLQFLGGLVTTKIRLYYTVRGLTSCMECDALSIIASLALHWLCTQLVQSYSARSHNLIYKSHWLLYLCWFFCFSDIVTSTCVMCNCTNLRPDSTLRLWRYINHLLTYLRTYLLISVVAFQQMSYLIISYQYTSMPPTSHLTCWLPKRHTTVTKLIPIASG